MKRVIIVSLILLSFSAGGYSQKGRHSFKLGETEFLLDGKPFRMISSELHPARIPAQSWQHRIQLAKSLGCNTIAITLFWNYHETAEGVFDFETENRNIAEFIRLVQEEEMFLIVKPGPYSSAGWDFGGIPPYLARKQNMKLRSTDDAFIAAVARYFEKLSEILKPWQVSKGGPLLMLQIEDEYASYDSDKKYLLKLIELWRKNGLEVPTFTAETPSEKSLVAGTVPGSAVGLKFGCTPADFKLASGINPGVPVFVSEVETDKPSHWREQWMKGDSLRLVDDVKFLMENNKSFNLILQGGTNFGFTSGATDGEQGYQPYTTSFDYNALVSDHGQPTKRFMTLRELIGSYQKGNKFSGIPKTNDPIEVTAFFLQPFASIWDNLPEAIKMDNPATFESIGQDFGLVLYRTTISDTTGGILRISGVHDYATVFVNEKYIGKIDRIENIDTIIIPPTSGKPMLEILVESMGRVSAGNTYLDKKGITGTVTLNGNPLTNWNMYKLALDGKFVYNLRSGKTLNKPGVFLLGNFMIFQDAGVKKGDTYFDMTNFTKGIIWVNGHNLGRYWNEEPQKRYYCPESWIRDGYNEVLVFDLHETKARMTMGYTKPE